MASSVLSADLAGLRRAGWIAARLVPSIVLSTASNDHQICWVGPGAGAVAADRANAEPMDLARNEAGEVDAVAAGECTGILPAFLVDGIAIGMVSFIAGRAGDAGLV